MAFSDTQINEFKRLLDSELQQLHAALALIDQSSQPVELDQNKVGRLSRMDAMQGQALAQAGEQRQKQRLLEVQCALTRISSTGFGSTEYGRCNECDQWIAEGRLLIDPAAEYCVTCAAELEAN